MLKIVEHKVDLEIPVGEGIHVLVAQIPNRLKLKGRLYRIADRENQRELFFSVLDVAAKFPEDERVNFLVFPESTLPLETLEEAAEYINASIPENTVIIFGLEHITLKQYRGLLERYREDNLEVLESVVSRWEKDQQSKPVNACVTCVREVGGRTRYFLFAKTHPFAGEENLEHHFDLYRGKAFLLFSCRNVPFNFMPLVCFDFVYRDLHHSNVMTIIERANELYFSRHQNLDLLAVIQCNPKPDHRVFRDVVTGFYGEHLFKTPGTVNTLTVFSNSSSETELEGVHGPGNFGHSSILCAAKHKLPRIKLSEFMTDDFAGSPVSRLRFNHETRLFTCRLFPYHETDPRSSRTAIKVTGVYRPLPTKGWERMSGEDLLMGIPMDPDNSIPFS
ncbi:MAG: hypothetical protein JXR72_07655 [Proteobacteria bacterium]|nr:hypothetical protein [Pseudomonadota bacterium]